MQTNIQTFFPSLPSPALQNAWPPPPLPPSTSGSTTDHGRLAKAVAATAVSTFAFWGLLFFLLHLFITRRQRRRRQRQAEEEAEKSRPAKISLPEGLRARASKRKTVFVDEDGLDATYWREFIGMVGAVHGDVDESRSGRRVDDDEESVGPGDVDEAKKKDRRIQEEPLLPDGFISSSSPIFDDRSSFSTRFDRENIDQNPPPPPNLGLPLPPGRFVSSAARPPAAPPELWPPRLPTPARVHNSKPQRPPSPATTASEVRNTRPPRPPSPSRIVFSAPRPAIVPPEVGNAVPSRTPSLPSTVTSEVSSISPPTLPTPSEPGPKPNAAPPPPLLPPARANNPAPKPPPPPNPSAKGPPPPPPRPPTGKPPGPAPPPPPPGGRPSGGSSRPPSAPGPASAVPGQGGATKLKPLHWDKMNAINVEHSMVWDRLHNGSFK